MSKSKLKLRETTADQQPIDLEQHYVAQVTAKWQSTVTTIIETGLLLIEAKEKLEGRFGDLFPSKLLTDNSGRFPFSQRTAQALMAIARHPVLTNPQHVAHLPPCWGTLAALSAVDDAELEEFIEKGMINADTTRKDLAPLKFGRRIIEFQHFAKALRVMIHFRKRGPRFSMEQLVEQCVFLDSEGWLSDEDLAWIAALPEFIDLLHEHLKRELEQRRQEPAEVAA